MSLILEALKKVDDEKKRDSQGSMDIAVDILRQEEQNPKRKIMVLLGALALTFVIAATAAYRLSPLANNPVALSPAVQDVPLNKANTAMEAPPISVKQAEPVSPFQGRVKAEPDNAVQKKHPNENPGKKTASLERANSPALLQDMEISVIVWYEEPSERKAVINGTAVKEGDTCEGARVKQIYPSRIVFVKDGKSFEKSINK